ncbi:hypothetical protein RhiirA4_473504 [Rhizophagus irregularis]|uniref:Uncharacterized protein n=1 Tax=Rhizophagus irregularis TaxID=588596 RepID=A0A2I1H6U9_9GLOM|nr:hypothetical protein RhiirA4_463173 [Rhizophagus irregularis]PKY54609.1 hypothetical protein RhiirA4_473504 [Rhizophagus irregularis]
MSSKKYHIYSVRRRVFTDKDLKESFISLERNVSKIHQNLKNISLEIYCLYAISSEEEFEERIELTDSSDSDYEYEPCKAPTYKVEMESERQAKRIPEGPSEKNLSNNLPSDPGGSNQEIEEATKLKEYLSQPCKPIIDTGSDLTILSEDYAKCPGLKIVPISPEK